MTVKEKEFWFDNGLLEIQIPGKAAAVTRLCLSGR
jgi:hypothetical protein